MRRWSRYKEFRTKLEELGYFVSEQVLNALDFGVPQSRRRLFLLCDNKRKPDEIKKIRSSRRLNARTFIDLNGKYKWAVLATKQRAKATMERAERAESVVGQKKPFIIVYYGSDHAGGWQKLNAPLRTITTLDRFAVVKTQKRMRVMRMLQVSELQQAMGMQGMRLETGTRRDRIKLLGNAVCPAVMQKVVNSLTNSEKKRGVRKYSNAGQK
jgi:DNA (cytosine-5)-methyltransferase 1